MSAPSWVMRGRRSPFAVTVLEREGTFVDEVRRARLEAVAAWLEAHPHVRWSVAEFEAAVVELGDDGAAREALEHPAGRGVISDRRGVEVESESQPNRSGRRVPPDGPPQNPLSRRVPPGEHPAANVRREPPHEPIAASPPNPGDGVMTTLKVFENALEARTKLHERMGAGDSREDKRLERLIRHHTATIDAHLASIPGPPSDEGRHFDFRGMEM